MSDPQEATPPLWSVYHERQYIQIDGLTFEQAWKIIAATDPRNRQYWVMWREGMTSWQSTTDFEGSDDFLRDMAKMPMSYPAVPREEDRRRGEEEREVGIFEFQDQHVAIDLDTSTVKDNRKHRRFRQRYLIEVEHDGQKFSTHTFDISLGGMQLEEPLPPKFPSSFHSRLVQENGNDLYLKCSFADPHEIDRQRIRFILNEAKSEQLRTLLLAHPLLNEEE